MIIKSLSSSEKKRYHIDYNSYDKIKYKSSSKDKSLRKSKNLSELNIKNKKLKETIEAIENKIQQSRSYKLKFEKNINMSPNAANIISTNITPKILDLKKSILTPKSKLMASNKLPVFFHKNKFKQQDINHRIVNLNNGIDKCLKQHESQLFQIIKKLGQGVNGDVMLAKVRSINLLIALKTFKKNKIKMKLFIQEVKIQSFINHPNIVKLYGIYTDKENIYLILETCSYNLFRQIKTQRGFSEEKTRKYVKQVLEAVYYLHSRNIIHRDIKPENILNINGVLKLCDFGWSVFTGQNEINQGMRKTFCGTYDYVSPEVSNGYLYNEKIDSWSIGILTYQMFTGNVPFKQKLILEKQVIYFNQKFSLKMKNFINRLLNYDPKLRMSIKEALNHDWIVEGELKKLQNNYTVCFTYQQEKLIIS